MIELAIKNIPALAAIGASLFAFLKWIDLRRREIANDEFEKVFRLIMIVTGQHPNGTGARMIDQIAAVWMLKEFPRYRQVIRKALDRDYSALATPEFNANVEPEIRAMMQELPKEKSKT